ncbi:DUF305 domain-containing protein [Micavibrio aeruginosavorus]|uniref:DUF305 domain-containing protein n=1 Tax=Micavibrio aeruginosavorus (strain ARL-13) TaxID=856793 RepID=G2KMP7_MICAA|nr:DUF305 domain-containing protein [Micavibrio aeruginosavorus]AEP08434.1 conserved hypothetical protein [Micavibrio aeruginosavorus ARL-13]
MIRTIRLFAVLALLAGVSAPALASVEPDYDPSKPRVTTPWYGMMTAANQKADMTFITGMRPHHAGALTMSTEYLAHPDAANATLKQLARGIIHNQTFEISMLDKVESHIDDFSFTGDRPVRGQIATRGLAQQQQFKRAPMPGPLDMWAGSRAVSAEDVRFAKAMIIHHEGALDMANAYLADPNANNGYLKLMSLDILRDQEMEIDLMKSIIGKYKGNPNDIKIDPSMVHGMDHMMHGSAAQAAPEKSQHHH